MAPDSVKSEGDQRVDEVIGRSDLREHALDGGSLFDAFRCPNRFFDLGRHHLHKLYLRRCQCALKFQNFVKLMHPRLTAEDAESRGSTTELP